MNRIPSRTPSYARLALGAAATACGLAAALPAAAALTDLAQGPLASSSSGIVKPNVSFVLDSSGSMAWSHAPDESEPFASQVGYKSSQCNSIFYRPDIKYVPPKKADGTDYANSSFTGAWKDGYNTGSGTVNLSTSFYAYDNSSSNGNGTDTAQPAYYYTYTGTQTANYQSTTNPFYTECNMDEATGPTATITVTGSGNTSVSSIKVNGVQIMTGTSTSSSTRNTVASNVAAKIGANGFDANSSGSTITVIGPAGTTGTPVVTKSGGMTFNVGAFQPFPFTKHVVSSTSGPGSTDERQNFANWFSYYRIRLLMMKSGAGRAFATIGSTYRVGFMTIYATPSNSTTDPSYLAINDFDQTQKNSFYSKFYAQNASGSTPLKTAFSTAGRNFAGVLGPDPLQYSCQQNFLILTTDGYWNSGTPNAVKTNGSTSVGNQDNSSTATPRPMYDGGLSGSTNTLADAASYYYNTDLRTTNCNSGVAGADVCQNNVPISGNDNAAWQHMTTFTLGLGVNGQLQYASDYLTGGSPDFNAILSGSKNWPTPTGDTLTTIDDLWHAAVNGHGQYFSAKNPDLLVSGLRQALAGVSAREAAGAAAATSNLEPVAGDNSAFVANYRTVKWDGDVEARTINLSTGAISDTANWSAQTQLDASVQAGTDSRTIYTFLGGAQVNFLPSSFSAAQKTAWFTPTAAPALSQASGWTAVQTTAATADTLINFLRGQFGFEERSPANSVLLYRTREHVLGDIINGKPVYVKVPPFNYSEHNYSTFKAGLASRQGVVYVAANDGMLHAFNSDTGQEMWAYVPSFVLPNLKALADDNYANAHQFYVDGSPVANDVWTGTAWKTVLVGGLNGGGKGYYAIDITNPVSPVVMWEFSNTNLGYSYGNPVMGKLTDGSWVVVFSSGYNNTPVTGNTSADGVGRLFVVDAMTGVVKFTISTAVGTSVSPSGLGKVSAWVDNSLTDNTLARVYGGDMLGNLWRFDINDLIAPAGKEATQLAFFQAGTYVQPITTAPELGLVNGVPMIYVGTGRYLGASDVNDQGQQSLYGIIDQMNATGIGNARTETTCPLVQQTITVLSDNTRSTTVLPVDFASKCGWFEDFNPANASPGERVNVDPRLQLGVLAVATNIPENSVCTVGGSSFLYFLDYTTGSVLPTASGAVAGTRIGNSIAVGLNTYKLPDGRVVTTITTSDDKHPVSPNPTSPIFANAGKRVMFRELTN